MDSRTIKEAKAAAELAVDTAARTGQRVEVVPLKKEIKVNLVKREEVKLPT